MKKDHPELAKYCRYVESCHGETLNIYASGMRLVFETMVDELYKKFELEFPEPSDHNKGLTYNDKIKGKSFREKLGEENAQKIDHIHQIALDGAHSQAKSKEDVTKALEDAHALCKNQNIGDRDKNHYFERGSGYLPPASITNQPYESFDFLRNAKGDYAELYQYAQQAQRGRQYGPKVFANSLRPLFEKLVDQLCQEKKIPEVTKGKEGVYFEKLNSKEFKAKVDKDTRDQLHKLREAGNRGMHRFPRATEKEIMDGLRAAHAICKEQLKHGQDVSAVTFDEPHCEHPEQTSLFKAAEKDDLEKFKQLLKEQAVNSKGEVDQKVIEDFLKEQDDHGDTPLHKWARNKCERSKGKSPHLAFDHTLFCIAPVCYGSKEKYDASLGDNFKKDFLVYKALVNNDGKTVEMMQHRQDLNPENIQKKRESNQTLLHFAAQQGNGLAVANLLSKLDINEQKKLINLADGNSQTPLQLASAKGEYHSVQKQVDVLKDDKDQKYLRAGLNTAAQNGKKAAIHAYLNTLKPEQIDELAKSISEDESNEAKIASLYISQERLISCARQGQFEDFEKRKKDFINQYKQSRGSIDPTRHTGLFPKDKIIDEALIDEALWQAAENKNNQFLKDYLKVSKQRATSTEDDHANRIKRLLTQAYQDYDLSTVHKDNIQKSFETVLKESGYDLPHKPEPTPNPDPDGDLKGKGSAVTMLQFCQKLKEMAQKFGQPGQPKILHFQVGDKGEKIAFQSDNIDDHKVADDTQFIHYYIQREQSDAEANMRPIKIKETLPKEKGQPYDYQLAEDYSVEGIQNLVLMAAAKHKQVDIDQVKKDEVPKEDLNHMTGIDRNDIPNDAALTYQDVAFITAKKQRLEISGDYEQKLKQNPDKLKMSLIQTLVDSSPGSGPSPPS